jgi:hypothetical protein
VKVKDEEAILRSCEVLRPGAKIITRRTADGTVPVVVWKVEVDHLVSPDAKVPSGARWRAQVVSKVEADGGVWFWPEGQGSTKERAIEAAFDF